MISRDWSSRARVGGKTPHFGYLSAPASLGVKVSAAAARDGLARAPTIHPHPPRTHHQP